MRRLRAGPCGVASPARCFTRALWRILTDPTLRPAELGYICCMEQRGARLADLLLRGAEVGEEVGLVDSVKASHRMGDAPHLTVETVFTDDANPLDMIRPNARLRRSSVGAVRLIQIWDDEGEWFLAAWPTQYRGVFHIVTNEHSTHSRWKRAERWLSAPREITRVFLDADDFLSLAMVLTEFGDAEVGRVTARSPGDSSSIALGWSASAHRPRPGPYEVIAEQASLGNQVRTITLHLPGQLSFHLRRRAGATFYSGDFDLFAEIVLSRLALSVHNRRQLLSGRQRRDHEPARALSLTLVTGEFSDAESTAEVIRAVSDLSKTTLAVVHRNPYLHLVMTDETDGSSFDVLVTDDARIDVFPGYRATTSALSRLANQLVQRFGTANLSERPSKVWKLADLIES